MNRSDLVFIWDEDLSLQSGSHCHSAGNLYVDFVEVMKDCSNFCWYCSWVRDISFIDLSLGIISGQNSSVNIVHLF